MAKFTVRYECREYYEKTYEADSFDDAETMFYSDDKLFDCTPLNSDVELVDVLDENGNYFTEDEDD